MDHLEKAIDVVGWADRLPVPPVPAEDEITLNLQLAITHALIALAEMLDSVTYSDEHGNRYIRVSSE